MRLDLGKRKGPCMVVDEELNQNSACRGNTLAVVAQNGKEIFVLSHCLMRLHEELFKCNK